MTVRWDAPHRLHQPRATIKHDVVVSHVRAADEIEQVVRLTLTLANPGPTLLQIRELTVWAWQVSPFALPDGYRCTAGEALAHARGHGMTTMPWREVGGSLQRRFALRPAAGAPSWVRWIVDFAGRARRANRAVRVRLQQARNWGLQWRPRGSLVRKTLRYAALVKRRLPPTERDICEIEPTEAEEFHFDFVLPKEVKVVIFGSFVSNLAKVEGAVGWTKETHHRLAAHLIEEEQR